MASIWIILRPRDFREDYGASFMRLPSIFVYLDDLLVFGSSVVDYNENLKKAQRRLQENGLPINVKKKIFRQTRCLLSYS